jgi:hypothetical protein
MKAALHYDDIRECPAVDTAKPAHATYMQKASELFREFARAS